MPSTVSVQLARMPTRSCASTVVFVPVIERMGIRAGAGLEVEALRICPLGLAILAGGVGSPTIAGCSCQARREHIAAEGQYGCVAQPPKHRSALDLYSAQ